MNKLKTQEFLQASGILSPKSICLTNASMPLTKLQKLVRKQIRYPCVVKPNESGSSIGIKIVDNPSELIPALRSAFMEDASVIVQEYIKGRELTCGVLGNTGQTPLVALPPIEIIPEGRFFDFSSKYSSTVTNEICPAPLNKQRTNRLQHLAKHIHEHLGCDGLTRSDFILTPDGKFYFLEINTIPGTTEQSLCPKEAKAAGMSFAQLLDKQIKLALIKKKNRIFVFDFIQA